MLNLLKSILTTTADDLPARNRNEPVPALPSRGRKGAVDWAIASGDKSYAHESNF